MQGLEPMRRVRWFSCIGLFAVGCSAILDVAELSSGGDVGDAHSLDAAAQPPRIDATETSTPEKDAASETSPRPSYVEAVLADKPLAYWRLGDPEGPTAKDEVGSFFGKYSGTVSYGVNGPLRGGTSKAIRISGAGRMNADELARRAPSTWESFSLEIWCATSTVDLEGSLMGFFHTAGQNGPRLFREEPSDLLTYRDSTGNIASSTASPQVDIWYHVVLTVSKENVAILYVNGKAEKMLVVTDRPSDEGYFALGVDYDTEPDGGVAFNQYWNGSLAEAAVYTHALSPERVVEHFTAHDR